MAETPWHWRTISALSQQIHSGKLSPVELMEHLLARVEALDEALHAFRLVPRARALAARAAELTLRAGQDSGPLHGIPYAVKDIIDVAGLPTTAGSNLLLDNIAAADATVVQRLNQAGMVLLGKANTVQFAFGAPGLITTMARRTIPGMPRRTCLGDRAMALGLPLVLVSCPWH